MKYEDLKDLKPGDKVIAEISMIDVDDKNNALRIGDFTWIPNKHVIGVYHEPTKIKFTEEEKKEFDKLLERHPTAYLNNFLNAIWDYSKTYFVLHKRLFENSKVSINRKKQFEFARALENPDLIEVPKPKRYYVHLLSGSDGYLNKSKDNGDYAIGNKRDKRYWRTAFTKDEILQDTFEITDKALEEVDEDENDI